MRRKSERNKGKTSPEKKVEKPTRKSTRRRAKKSPSTSPERENSNDGDGITTEKESGNAYKIQTRLQSKETVENISEEPEAKVSSTDQLNDDIDDGGSVWKVARADASPGTIQKLKLCRQRNLSETSDISLSRKRINKRQEGGEGVAEEADSADERPAASNEKAYVGTLPLVEDTSSTTLGRESGEEVSDSKEIPPETTTVDLSDVKPNIDQQLRQQPEATKESIQHIDEDNDDHRRDDDDDDSDDDDHQDDDNCVSNQGSGETGEIEKLVEKSVVESRITPHIEEPDDSAVEKPDDSNPMEIVANVEKEQLHDLNYSRITESVEEEAPKSATSDDDEKLKTHKSREANSSDNSNDDSLKRTSRTSRSTRRKHRDKYRDSSNSDTAESEEETERSTADNEKKHVERNVTREESPPSKGGSSELDETNKQHDVPDDESKDKTVASVGQNDKDSFGTTGTHANTYKPAKVNLKRSFTSRVSVDESKREDVDSANDAGQNKENHVADESKCIPKRRRWGTVLSTDTAPVLSISTESLKALVPGAKPLSLNEVRLSKDDEDDRERHREKRYTPNDGDKLKESTDTKSDNLKDNHMAARRKISIVKEAPQLKSPSPPAAQPTNILLIKNLVRPFTLNQIKELLSRTGTIIENGFWMDRIKSKCFVEYSNEDQAFETRQALHGVSWPLSNPKKLQVEYATKEDMEKAKESSKDQPLSRKAEAMSGVDPWQQDWGRDEKSNSTTKVTVVREWDLGKEDGQHLLKDKDREKKDMDKKRRQRSRSPILEAHLPAPARKFKKKEDEPPPAKLLDDLFRKTKATPCIYWLPLTNEQIVVKEEMRRQHMAEHARRLEEMRRAERNRDSRRRRSPRK